MSTLLLLINLVRLFQHYAIDCSWFVQESNKQCIELQTLGGRLSSSALAFSSSNMVRNSCIVSADSLWITICSSWSGSPNFIHSIAAFSIPRNIFDFWAIYRMHFPPWVICVSGHQKKLSCILKFEPYYWWDAGNCVR